MPDIKRTAPQSNRSFTSSGYNKRNHSLSESFRDKIRKKDLFGIDGYYVPDNSYMLIGPKNFKIIKKEKGEKSYLDIETKRREFVPPPGQYMS